MNRKNILSRSPDQDTLASLDVTLRGRGMKAIAVMSPIQAGFEIEMGRCGVFLICYRLSPIAAGELSTLFRRNCHGPARRCCRHDEANINVPESSGAEGIVRALRRFDWKKK
jgi:hypothetical protein